MLYPPIFKNIFQNKCNFFQKISVPVKIQKETLSLYKSLNESGYNLFDSNDSFYNDICTPYTTENGTDISLNDRKEIIVDIGNDMNLCQTGCNLKSYDSSKNKATCICYVESTPAEQILMILVLKASLMIFLIL